MEEIQFPDKITATGLKLLYPQLFGDSIKNTDFVLPSKLKYSGFGIIPNAIIVFMTWLRLSKNGKVLIDIDIDDEESFKEFGSDYLGYSILSSAWKHKEIVNKKKISLKKYFKQYTQKFHKRIDFLQDLPNDAILIPFFDHYSKQLGLSHWFYNDRFEFAGSPEELDSSTYRIFSELGKIYKTKLVKNTNEIINDLEIIIWELLKNTDEHATKDYLNQTDLSPNIRGIYLEIHRSSKKNFISDAKNNSGLSNYLEDALLEGNNFLLEISVFDTGPGLPKRFKGGEWKDTISLAEEVNIIKQCLCKGVSSSTGMKGINKGFGLNNVLLTLNKKKGFIQIKTGRTQLYRDLLKSPHFETTDYIGIELQDIETNSPSNYTPTEGGLGTIITMFYPLK